MKLSISGYYGYNNAGDDAILAAIKQGFKEHEIFVLDASNRFNFQYIAKSDVLISGGGGLLQDRTSTRSLLYYLGIIWTAKRIFGKKVVILAQSIGPVKKSSNLSLLKKALRLVDVITVRDQSSFKFVESLNLTGTKLIKTADPIFALPRIEKKSQENQSSPAIAVCPRRFGHMPENFEENIAAICDTLVKDYNARVFFIPFHQKDDIHSCVNIMHNMEQKSELACDHGDFNDIIAMISKMDLVIGTRLHSLMFAVNHIVPAIGISYDPKVSAFMEEVSLPVFDPCNLSDIPKTVGDIFQNKEGVKRSIELIREEFHDRALLNFAKGVVT